MRYKKRTALAAVAVGTVFTTGTALAAPAPAPKPPPQVRLKLTPSTPQLAKCMPHASVSVTVKLTTDKLGFDIFQVSATGLPPKTAFTTFLLEKAGPPFGAAEYIGDFTSDKFGRASVELRLIVQEAFASTLVNGKRVRVDLNRVGAWFADPAADDFCLGKQSPITPFDGDNEAGVQAFNSANAAPLPPP